MLNFAQDNSDAFGGYLMRKGLLSEIGFGLQDCEGENSRLAKWIAGLNLQYFEDGDLLIPDRNENEYGAIVISKK